MKLSSKSRYAVMAMADIALYAKGKPVTLQQISERQGIAVNYLEQIFMKLRKNGIVKSIKGPGGGYILANDTSSIKISDVISAMNDSFKMTRCTSKSGCLVRGAKCMTHDIWAGLEQNIANYLRSISIGDILSYSTKNNLTPISI